MRGGEASSAGWGFVVKKWLTPWIVASFLRTTRLVEGHGTLARIDFGDVPTMTGQMIWSDRLLRIADRECLAGGRKHAYVFGNRDGRTASTAHHR